METLRILLLAYASSDIDHIMLALTQGRYRPDVAQVATMEEFRRTLAEREYDLILAEHGATSFAPISPIGIAQELAPSTPLIVLSDAHGEELAVDALKRGAADFVVKERLNRLLPAIDRTLREARERAQQRQAGDELKHAKEQAEEATRAREQFLATLSHELRTPLTPVLASISALEELTEMPESARSLLAILRRNIELETRLIDDLIDLNRISKKKVRLNMQLVDAHILIQEVIESCRPDIDAKHIEVKAQLVAEQSNVLADAPRLQQIIWNLLKNAIRFTNRNGTITITTANPSPDRFQFELSDDGAGIAPALLPRIFDPYEQGDQVSTRRSGCLGLGLAIAKALSDLHGGSLRASSEGIGCGATFTLELTSAPMASAEPIDGRTRRQTESDAHHLRILIVDDHEDTRRVIQMLLERRGYQTLIAQSVASALDVIASNEFDLLISDIGLPDGTGIDLLRSLRADGAQVKAIALSGYGMEEDIKRSKAAGFYEHLTKPVSIKKLQEVIDELVGSA